MIKKMLSIVSVMFALSAYVLPGTSSASSHGSHHLVLQINANDPALMNLVLNNAEQSKAAYEADGKKLEVEIVAYGPGLKMLLPGSPVAPRIQNFASNGTGIGFAACGNTMKKMSKKAGKQLELLEFSNIKMVPAGVVHIMQRQDQGWHYIKP
ncbi:MAG: DsrE family protein [Rhodospirillaceae bacterium]|nr:DsrE family protein [Rhodospirillaceae bacterium]